MNRVGGNFNDNNRHRPGHRDRRLRYIEYKNSRFTTLAYGSIQTPAHTDVEVRLEMIYDKLDELIKIYSLKKWRSRSFSSTLIRKTMVPGRRGARSYYASARGIIGSKWLNTRRFKSSSRSSATVERSRSRVMNMISMLLRLDVTPKLDDTCDALRDRRLPRELQRFADT